MKVVITDKARGDLQGIGEWIAKDSPRRGGSFVRELVGRCQGLAARSSRYPVVRTIRGRSIRRCVHGEYLVFFEIERSSAIVRVLRILHGASDYAQLLGAADGTEGDND